MSLLIATLLSFLAIEYFIRLPFIKYGKPLLNIANKSVSVLISRRISDHWKEKVLLYYARKLVLHTITLTSMLGFTLIMILLPAWILDQLFINKLHIIESFSSLYGLLSMSTAALIYILIRKHFGNF
jgi:hypothetical protein